MENLLHQETKRTAPHLMSFQELITNSTFLLHWTTVVVEKLAIFSWKPSSFGGFLAYSYSFIQVKKRLRKHSFLYMTSCNSMSWFRISPRFCVKMFIYVLNLWFQVQNLGLWVTRSTASAHCYEMVLWPKINHT